ncbi:uracil phosphoribosyltransferase [Bradymonas sediminis]|uniref:Uracil phosphoribosyltransferase n=1 Tax=Bradymonas sediminis TaxID=1548548 RepID=A0A2Z4FJ80_9DELT|nr:uracil phosphoribosyltransferase [Bradymonas sediminis]AWV88989.1 uracil phosphoribosyltransferase [Bradymonas sediminis]TDP72001.1 uracil phosphoribosyltransferase [Bradymonas sediminis]
MDSQYSELDYKLSQIKHHYGDNTHILNDPFCLTQLAKLCSPAVGQPQFNRLVEVLYQQLVVAVMNVEFPRHQATVHSRMKAKSHRGVFRGELIDHETEVVTVDIARAGTLPSQVCYTQLNELMNPERVRQDHLTMSRVTNPADEVVGATVSGEKVGGPVDSRIVLFPDPMGATGSSLSTAISYYKDIFGGKPLRMITLNLVFTPEFINRIKTDHPDVIMYALRLDRGMSSKEVLATEPGTHWEEESGLSEEGYIVPGGGGFGELMNNAWI